MKPKILNVSSIDWTAPSRTRSTLTHDHVIKWTKAKVHVDSDSVLSLEKMEEHSEAIQRWKDQLGEFRQSDSYRIIWNWWRTDWVPVEYFPRTCFMGDPAEGPKKTCKIWTLNLKILKDGIVFMSMFNDIDWTKRGNSAKCISNSEQVKNYAERFSRGNWTFSVPGDEKKWCGTLSYTPEGKWDSIVTEVVGHFAQTGHPVFKGISASESWNSEKRVIQEAQKEQNTVHFATRMDICHLKNAEWQPTFQKCKGRVVLRGDIVKDDSGACAVFAEQGVSAAKGMDVMARLTTRLWWTSSWRHTSIHSGEDGRCSQTAQNSKVRMSRCMDTPSTT